MIKRLSFCRQSASAVAPANPAPLPPWTETTNSPPPSLSTPPPLPPDEEGRDADAVEANRKQLAALLDDAERQLGSTPYLAGSEYSMADVMMSPVIYRTGVTVRLLGGDWVWLNAQLECILLKCGLHSSQLRPKRLKPDQPNQPFPPLTARRAKPTTSSRRAPRCRNTGTG
jgi:glutathione S-transferase